NSKRDSLLVKFSRPKRHPTKGVSQWIIILENYSD
ncbi:polysaccharide deacetylase family protein, partial [Enterococcus faecium]|nr:polysaccharide deacetylase family protein [Enterococcus faecium]MCZ1236166.1 polysaccharide deacetylase family protein [Enterococcus faecium]MCZ1241618.1 polysaccharide deacetylase family protein [Enterococcus faecium]MCZ1257525.1 polysaccharide deacetylase family protein [Enterococcus faecium]MCZ1297798.1 polysaccharide deacetylase family protein [Enterococcus faecium]